MATEVYTYPITDFLYNTAAADRLDSELHNSTITIAVEYVTIKSSSVAFGFKTELSGSEITTLSGIVATHTGEHMDDLAPPVMTDGRPLVRADTRPLSTSTYFTMAGDTASGIGMGKHLCWDFSNDDDIVDLPYDPEPEGYKTKQIALSFIDPIYLKDGSLYFFDAPWGAYCDMHIVVPAGNYYPNDHGAIPASALGLSGTQMYSYASEDVIYLTYVNKHHMYGDCPMGDELNAEGAAVDALPVGWQLVGHITTVSGDNTSKGYASFECYRARTIILEGDTP